MLDDGDTVLNLMGVGLVLAVLVGLAVVGLNFSAASGEDVPDAEWTIERVNASVVEITHADGDPVRTDDLRVTVDSVSRDTSWTDPVTEGESTTVPASDSSLVRVVWNGGRGDREIMASQRT